MEKYICRKPGKKSVKIIERDHAVISQCVTREYSFVFKQGKGCYIWDVDGRKYLDFAAGVAVMNVGHTNPVVMRAIAHQTKISSHAGFADFYAELPVRFAETLVSFLPSPLKQAFLSNSGTESIEAAYKLARWHKNKKYVIAFKNAFHGRTMGSLSMTNSKKVQRERYAPFLPVRHVPYPYAYQMRMEPEACTDFCLSQLEKTIKQLDGNIAAIFMEPIQGEGGYVVPPKSFVKGVRKLCNNNNVLLCDDEVQAGCWRTGKFLAISNFGVKPDIVSMSKAIGGGIPLGATISSKKIMDWPHGSHANTFGGNLLACAAGISTLNFMKEKRLGENAVRRSREIMKRLHEIKENYEIVGDVRGIGLMIGVEIVNLKKTRTPAPEKRNAILCKASEKGLILLGAGKSVIRICPPLIISQQQAEKGIDILEDAIKVVNNGRYRA
ncbi:MAG: aminotransferase class III-fold pyridoxal phosphate-dependent enzyme [Candidatus Aenigmarchaeota archaeon]|nr:aminotransferase class III-fold pyridoxal phosphate-dependent enzyme [Candidatus Aenigmarchaeota archaeon]